MDIQIVWLRHMRLCTEQACQSPPWIGAGINKVCLETAGTPLFLPPEMFMRHWGPEADLWSLGMVTYQLLSGAARRHVSSESCRYSSNQVLAYKMLRLLRVLPARCVLSTTLYLAGKAMYVHHERDCQFRQQRGHAATSVPCRPHHAADKKASRLSICASAGVLPFWGGTSDNVSPLMVMQEILGGDIRFDTAAWESISPEAADFVNRLLDRDYNTRMTAEQALQHPWIADLFCEADGEHSGAYLAPDASLRIAVGRASLRR